jgi:ribonucleoside-diphosphate reductase alpha chain
LKFAKVINECLRFFNQNGKRLGAAAIYLDVFHKDVEQLIEARKQTGAHELRARDIFPALFIPDNFMRAVENDEDYWLFCHYSLQNYTFN